MNYHTGNFHYNGSIFDAQLSFDPSLFNLRLRIFLKVSFRMYNRGSGFINRDVSTFQHNESTHVNIPVQPWTSNEFNDYCQTLQNRVEHTWGGEREQGIFFITPPNNFFYFDFIPFNQFFFPSLRGHMSHLPGGEIRNPPGTYSTILRPKIVCSLKLIPVTRNPHLTVYVVNLRDPTRNIGSHYRPSQHTLYLDNNDHNLVSFNNSTYNLPNSNQITVCHEFGHAIGLSHIGTYRHRHGQPNLCSPNDSNATGCYVGTGKSRWHDTETIMGSGMNMDTLFSLPWLYALANLTNTNWNDWAWPSLTPLAASLIR